jgi:hypothetical protein
MQQKRFTAIAIALALSASAQEAPSVRVSPRLPNKVEHGTICVLPNSPDPPTRVSPGGEYNPLTLTISVDSRKPLLWPHKHLVKIEELDLTERHLIVLRSDGKPIQSFRFGFPTYKDTKLCVSFDGYQGVQFGDKYDTYWCRCK